MRGRWLEICLSLVVAGVIAASGSSGALASEIFICDDGRQLKVDSSNRATLYNDPCVKDWFANNAVKEDPPRLAVVAATHPSGVKRTLNFQRIYVPVVGPRTVSRPEQRTQVVRSYIRANGTVVDSYRRSPRGTLGRRR